jgi:hypothetical protein
MPSTDTALANSASRYLVTDRVRPAQAATYRRVLRTGRTGDPMRDFLGGMTRAQVELYAGSDHRSAQPPKLMTDKLKGLFPQIDHRSHRWVKGMMATALAMDDESARAP